MQAANMARINDLMRRAVQMERQGNRNAAIRFAISADAVVRTYRVPLNPEAESPAQFVARLQGRPVPSQKPKAQPVMPAGNPFVASPQNPPPVRDARPTPTVPGADSPAKREAKAVLAQARQAFDAGELGTARALALEAQKMDAAWVLFEESPEQLLADIERKTNTTTFSASPFPTETSESQPVAGNPFAPSNPKAEDSNPFAPKTAADTGNPFTTAQQPAAAVNQNEINKKQANHLMDQAKHDAQNRQFAAARQKLQEAEGLNVIYTISDERPELVLEDLNRMESETATLAGQQPGTPLNPADAAKRGQAQKLLEQARADIRGAQYEAAQAKLDQVRQLNAEYEQFDDTPELVAELLKKFQQPVETEAAPRFPDFPAPVQAVTSQETKSPNLPPVPGPVQETDPVKPQSNPFATLPATETPRLAAPGLAEDEGTFDIAKKVAAAPKPANNIVHPSGVVATELFDRGLKHFHEGEYEEAYAAFLKCYRTGQHMDPYRAQSLQDMLQTLRPMIAKNNAGKIQQVKNETEGKERRVGPGTDNDFQPGKAVDLAKKEQAVKYEKLRSETLNAIFQADRMKEKKPTEALELIDRTLANVSDADLTEKQLTPLVRQLKVARSEIEASKNLKAPLLALEARNKEVKALIKKERQKKVRVEQEMADMVEEFNTFFKQRRYAEAEVVAKKAKELDPENPVTVTMFWKARFARRIARNEELVDAKEDGFIRQLDNVEWAAVPFDDSKPYQLPKNWAELSKKRAGRYGADNRIRTEKEKQIEKSLSRPISLHFTNAPLNEVIKHIATSAGIDVVVDNVGLGEEGVPPDQEISIDVNGIMLSSALNLMLKPMRLAYMIQDEVLKVTSQVREQGKLDVVTYPVADLVIAIPNFRPSDGYLIPSSGAANYSGAASYSVPAGGLKPVGGQQFPPANLGNASNHQNDPWAIPGLESSFTGKDSGVDFDTLSELIVSTIEPETWAESGGGGSVRPYETTLSLVIRQTQKVHEEIRDLLEQLRRMQDLQVTIEVRFITVADRFFEQIGIDFDFNVPDNVEGDTLGATPPAFGAPLGGNQAGNGGNAGIQAQVGVAGIGGGPGSRNAMIMGVPAQIPGGGGGMVGFGGIGGVAGGNAGGVAGGNAGGVAGGNAGGAAGAAGGAAGGAGFFLQPNTNLNLPSLDNWPKNGTIVGLQQPGQFTPNLDVAFRQGSFDLGAPDFGGFNPDAGVQVGMAILSDIEAFFFVRAAQADKRTNIMFAPKVTLYNGQSATVQDNTQRPFVTSLVPTVGFFSVGFTPQITVIPEGVTLTVSAVISADRRFVRLTVIPFFSNITDVFTFTFQGGGGGGGAAGQGGGAAGQGGGIAGGQGGANGAANNGVQGQGGFNPIGGAGGIGGGPNPFNMLALGVPTQMGSSGQVGFGGIGGIGGGGNRGGNGGGASTGTTTLQQPVVEVVSVTTTVSVPDGGTVLLGGIKRLREGRNMAGVPILNKIPYVSRLFKNTGVGRETESLMLMVTPRIIIQEEEEELLGL